MSRLKREQELQEQVEALSVALASVEANLHNRIAALERILSAETSKKASKKGGEANA